MSVPTDPPSPKPVTAPREPTNSTAPDRTVGQQATGSLPAGPSFRAGPGRPVGEGELIKPGMIDSEPPDSVGAVVTDTEGLVPSDRISGVSTQSRHSDAADSRTSERGGDTPSSPVTESPAADHRSRPSFRFFGIVAAISLIADVGSKAWAEIALGQRTLLDPAMVLVADQLRLTLAYNRGGAWGLLQNAGDNLRRPFFLLVSLLAIAFIVSLYSRLASGQRALKWGLPLVLGGALGNLSDRIVRGSVIDFIDYRAGWVESMNTFISSYLWQDWTVTDHWPTFNVADISICIGVGLMAVDMIASKRGHPSVAGPDSEQPEDSSVDQAAESDSGLASFARTASDSPDAASQPEPAGAPDASGSPDAGSPNAVGPAATTGAPAATVVSAAQPAGGESLLQTDRAAVADAGAPGPGNRGDGTPGRA